MDEVMSTARPFSPVPGADVLPTTVIAPAKLNLALHLGPARDDGLHELRSIFLPLALADELRIEPLPFPQSGADGGLDEVVCAGVTGRNLVDDALARLREVGWNPPPLRITITKLIPVAAGLGGGSADAAAVLSLARGVLPDDELREIAFALGADVPSQIEPAAGLVSGAGEHVEPLPAPSPLGIVLVAYRRGLGAGEVYAEADRIGIGAGRSQAELDEISASLRAGFGDGTNPQALASLVVNDLGVAARSLRPELNTAIDALERSGALIARVTGSGPTVFGLFPDARRAAAAADELAASGRFDSVIATSLATGRPPGTEARP